MPQHAGKGYQFRPIFRWRHATIIGKWKKGSRSGFLPRGWEQIRLLPNMAILHFDQAIAVQIQKPQWLKFNKQVQEGNASRIHSRNVDTWHVENECFFDLAWLTNETWRVFQSSNDVQIMLVNKNEPVQAYFTSHRFKKKQRKGLGWDKEYIRLIYPGSGPTFVP